MTHDPFYALGNFIGDVMLIAFVALVAAVPVLLLRGLYRRQRRALLERDK